MMQIHDPKLEIIFRKFLPKDEYQRVMTVEGPERRVRMLEDVLSSSLVRGDQDQVVLRNVSTAKSLRLALKLVEELETALALRSLNQRRVTANE